MDMWSVALDSDWLDIYREKGRIISFALQFNVYFTFSVVFWTNNS